jgi:hypothetical protein
MKGSVDNGRLGGWRVGEVKYLKKLRADNAYHLTRLPKNILSVLAVSGVDINAVLTAQMRKQLFLDRSRLKGQPVTKIAKKSGCPFNFIR